MAAIKTWDIYWPKRGTQFAHEAKDEHMMLFVGNEGMNLGSMLYTFVPISHAKTKRAVLLYPIDIKYENGVPNLDDKSFALSDIICTVFESYIDHTRKVGVLTDATRRFDILDAIRVRLNIP